MKFVTKHCTIVTAEFAAGHLYHQKKWSVEKNQAEFGKCFSEYGHGHNYRLEVAFEEPALDSAIDPATARTHWLADLNAAVRAVTDLLDHKHLNFAVPEFAQLIPTTENIALYLLKNLQRRCPSETVSYIKLFETDNLWVEIKL
jgi:6-pyruvoyltetrahydropterin/6-carboxytetrahydropterin synthase